VCDIGSLGRPWGNGANTGQDDEEVLSFLRHCGTGRMRFRDQADQLLVVLDIAKKTE
jgi:hypothetical protein